MKNIQLKSDKKKKIHIILMSLLLISIILLVRLFIILHINYKYEKNMQYDENLGYAKYYKQEDGYIFKYRSASYLSTDAFATVCSEDSQKIYMDSDGEFYTKGIQVTLYVWPFTHKMGLDFYELNGSDELSEQVYIDNELNCITKGLTKEQLNYIEGLIDSNRNEITILIKKADEQWNIN